MPWSMRCACLVLGVWLLGPRSSAADPKLELVVQTGHAAGVTSVATSEDGRQVLTGSRDQTAIVWDGRSGQQLQTLKGHTGWINSVALSADGKRALTASQDGTAVLWDAQGGEKLRTFTGHSDAVTAVAWSADGKRVFTGSRDGTTRLWDASTGEELCRLLSLDGGEDWLVVTPEGFFDGSNGAWKLMAFRETGTLNVVDDDATRKKFYRPGLLGTLYRGEKPKP